MLLKKTKDRATIWVAIPFLGIYPEKKYSFERIHAPKYILQHYL